MNKITEELFSRRSELIGMRNDAVHRMGILSYQGVPKYSLRISSQRNQMYLKNGSEVKYLKKDKYHLAAQIAEYDYLSKVISKIDSELIFLDKYLGLCDRTLPEDYYESLSQGRQKLIVPVRLTDKQFVEKWIATPYEKKPFAEDDETEFYTDNGERVRSKSEVLIANAMKKHGIPYKYECPIVLKGIGKIHPDFTALNIRRRKIYYWEHLGKMDDPDYARKNTFRLNMYEKNGLFHGDSLITTRETSPLPLDTKLLDRIIDHYLLN